MVERLYRRDQGLEQLMAKQGLGQVDLNVRARLAIMGMSEDPARDLGVLFSSGQPIEASTRELLTDLFGGRALGTELVLKNTGSAAVYRRVRKRLVMTAAVGTICKLDQHGEKTKAKEQLASHFGCSLKTIERYLTLKQKADRWASHRMGHRNNPVGTTTWHLFVAFLYADATKQQPHCVVKSSLPSLCAMLESADQEHADGVTSSDSPISKIRFR